MFTLQAFAGIIMFLFHKGTHNLSDRSVDGKFCKETGV